MRSAAAASQTSTSPPQIALQFRSSLTKHEHELIISSEAVCSLSDISFTDKETDKGIQLVQVISILLYLRFVVGIMLLIFFSAPFVISSHILK